jgi:hypothetical protein
MKNEYIELIFYHINVNVLMPAIRRITLFVLIVTTNHALLIVQSVHVSIENFG